MIILDKFALEMSYEFASKTATITLSEPVDDDVIVAYFTDLSMGKVWQIGVWLHGKSYRLQVTDSGWTRIET